MKLTNEFWKIIFISVFLLTVFLIIGIVFEKLNPGFWNNIEAERKAKEVKQEELKQEEPSKSIYEKNMDFARELDRMDTARQLDRMEEERRAINKYRESKD